MYNHDAFKEASATFRPQRCLGPDKRRVSLECTCPRINTQTSSSLMAWYRLARFFWVYLRCATNAKAPKANRERSANRKGIQAASLAIVASIPNGNQLVEHVEVHLSCETTWCCKGVNLSKAFFARHCGETNLQPVDELGHWNFLLGVVKDVQRLELGVASAVLELEADKVAELGSGTPEDLERQGGSVIGCTS